MIRLCVSMQNVFLTKIWRGLFVFWPESFDDEQWWQLYILSDMISSRFHSISSCRWMIIFDSFMKMMSWHLFLTVVRLSWTICIIDCPWFCIEYWHTTNYLEFFHIQIKNVFLIKRQNIQSSKFLRFGDLFLHISFLCRSRMI